MTSVARGIHSIAVAVEFPFNHHTPTPKNESWLVGWLAGWLVGWLVGVKTSIHPNATWDAPDRPGVRWDRLDGVPVRKAMWMSDLAGIADWIRTREPDERPDR